MQVNSWGIESHLEFESSDKLAQNNLAIGWLNRILTLFGLARLLRH